MKDDFFLTAVTTTYGTRILVRASTVKAILREGDEFNVLYADGREALIDAKEAAKLVGAATLKWL